MTTAFQIRRGALMPRACARAADTPRSAARLQKLWIDPPRTVDRSFKVDDFTHSNGTSLTSHVLLLLLSGLCDSSMDVTARQHSTLRCALDNADDCTRSPRSILVDLASMRMRGAHMRGTLSKLCAYQDASLMHADSLCYPPHFSTSGADKGE